jgi:glycosyltransferase involved in cell wall biosynthesis
MVPSPTTASDTTPLPAVLEWPALQPPRVRVTYLARYTAGGSALSLQTLLETLDRDQYDADILLHGLRDPAFTKAMETLRIPVASLLPRWHAPAPVPIKLNVTARLGTHGVRGRLLRAYRTLRALEGALRLDLRWQPALARELRRRRPALVHCNNGLRAHRLDLLVCAALRIPVVCHVRNLEPLTAVEHLAARYVWRFVYISRAVADNYQRQGIAPRRGLVIPNAVPAAAFGPLDPASREALGCGPDDFVVVNVGRLVRWKGQDVFLRAVAQARGRVPRLRAVIVGAADDDDRSRAFADELQRLATELGIAERVTFTGHRVDAPRVMSAADVVVHSAVSPEPFGRVIIEALAAGRPVVATRAGGVLDILDHGVTGLLVPPNDVGELAQALERLAADAGLRARLAAAGRQHAAAHYSAAGQRALVAGLYQACLAEHSA